MEFYKSIFYVLALVASLKFFNWLMKGYLEQQEASQPTEEQKQKIKQDYLKNYKPTPLKSLLYLLVFSGISGVLGKYLFSSGDLGLTIKIIGGIALAISILTTFFWLYIFTMESITVFLNWRAAKMEASWDKFTAQMSNEFDERNAPEIEKIQELKQDLTKFLKTKGIPFAGLPNLDWPDGTNSQIRYVRFNGKEWYLDYMERGVSYPQEPTMSRNEMIDSLYEEAKKYDEHDKYYNSYRYENLFLLLTKKLSEKSQKILWKKIYNLTNVNHKHFVDAFFDSLDNYLSGKERIQLRLDGNNANQFDWQANLIATTYGIKEIYLSNFEDNEIDLRNELISDFCNWIKKSDLELLEFKKYSQDGFFGVVVHENQVEEILTEATKLEINLKLFSSIF